MKRMILALSLVLALIGAVPVVGHADTVLTGTTDGGAFYKIVVPDAWNGDLVIWNHGFSLSPIGPVSDLGPLVALQLSEGYAVAANSYQQIGWALFKTKNDNQNMFSAFKANFGEPNNVLVYGGSLGGIVTAQTVEKNNFGNLVGAYPFCGAVAGSRNWDGALDLRLAYDAICASVPGAFIPGGPTGLPAPGFPDYPYSQPQMAVAAHACFGILAPPPFRTPAQAAPGFPDYPFGQTQMAMAAHACFGILAPPPFRTVDQAARLAQYQGVAQIPESFVLTDLGYGLFGMSNVIFDPAKLKGYQGMGNIGVTYSDPFIDANIQRVAAHPGAANRLKKNFTPVGDVGNVKIVSTHTSGDGLVIVENEKEYADVVPASNLTVAIVNEAPGATHCGYMPAEMISGWESLRGWVAGGPQPTAASIQTLCQLIALNPASPGPCRYDPTFVIPDMDGRILPR